MSKLVRSAHNATNLVYHIVCPIKYRRNVISDKVKYTIFRTCQSIAGNHDVYFIEVGTDGDHVHFLLQAVPTYSPTEIVRILKITIAKAVFKYNPEIKGYLWGGELWTDGYYMNTVSSVTTEAAVADYVRKQGYQDYNKLLDNSLYVSPNTSLTE